MNNSKKNIHVNTYIYICELKAVKLKAAKTGKRSH